MFSFRKLRSIAILLSLASLMGAATAVRAQKAATQNQLPFQAGEELVYQAEVSRSLLRGVDVAEFRLKMEGPASGANGSADTAADSFRLTADVVSKGFFVRLFGLKFHQQIESTVERSGFTALKTKKLDEQNKRVRTSEAIFDHQTRNVTWTERDPNNPSQPPRVVSASFTEPIQDVLSAVYFLRTQQLSVGQTFEIYMSDSGRVVRVPLKVVERKRMKTALGSVYAFRVEAALFGETGMVRGKGKFLVWVTDDPRRIPVRAQVKVDAGTFDIKLKRANLNTAALPH